MHHVSGVTPEHHRTWSALLDVGTERRRQDELRDAGRFTYTLADVGMRSPEKLACVLEELGEVARCVLSINGLVQEALTARELRTELVHVAALCVAWIEAVDRDIGPVPS